MKMKNALLFSSAFADSFNRACGSKDLMPSVKIQLVVLKRLFVQQIKDINEAIAGHENDKDKVADIMRQEFDIPLKKIKMKNVVSALSADDIINLTDILED